MADPCFYDVANVCGGQCPSIHEAIPKARQWKGPESKTARAGTRRTIGTGIRAVATRIYGAADIGADGEVLAEIRRLEEAGYGRYPICVATTQYSFSTDPKLRGAPTGHVVRIREVRLAAGAEFIVLICGDVLTMPGLPKSPSAERIDIDQDGRVVGLF